MHSSERDNVISLNPIASIPPQNIEAEEAILGGILLDPNAIARIAGSLQPASFYVSAHQDIYQAALTLHHQGLPTDLMTVTTWLYDHKLLDKVGGQTKIAQLIDRTVSAVNIDRYADLVMDKYQRRRLIQSGNEIVQLGYDTARELEDVLDESEQKIFSLTENQPSHVEKPVDILVRICSQIGKKEPGLQTDIYDLDKLLGGLNKKKLYVVAGRSGIGKTQLSVWLAHTCAIKQQKPVVFFSAEMDRDELMCRILACDSGIDSKAIAEGEENIDLTSENQSNKRPSISHLRESGGLEQAADAIMLLYRDDYYNADSPESGTIEITVGKQRGGATGTVKCWFKPEISHFLSQANHHI